MRSVLRRRDFNLQALSLCASGLWHGLLTAAERKTVLIVGDSLSAEYGIARGSGWVALLSAQIAREKPQWQVINASISGDTTAGGLARVPALLQQHQP